MDKGGGRTAAVCSQRASRLGGQNGCVHDAESNSDASAQPMVVQSESSPSVGRMERGGGSSCGGGPRVRIGMGRHIGEKRVLAQSCVDCASKPMG